MNCELLQHARDVLTERNIPVEWLERALREPELKQADSKDAALERRYRKIPERENRVLRVVVNTTVVREWVVSSLPSRRVSCGTFGGAGQCAEFDGWCGYWRWLFVCG